MVELIAPRNYCGVENLVPAPEQTRVLRACHTISNERRCWGSLGRNGVAHRRQQSDWRQAAGALNNCFCIAAEESSPNKKKDVKKTACSAGPKSWKHLWIGMRKRACA